MSDPGDETDEAPPPEAPAPASAPSSELAPPSPAIPVSTAPSPAAVAGPFNMLAVLSLILGAGYFVIGISLGLSGRTAPTVLLVMPAGAVVAGYVARGQIWRNRQRGRLAASAGIAFGYLGLALLVFGLALALLASH